MKPATLKARLGIGLGAGLLAWYGIYTLEFAWSVALHPVSWLRAYLEGPLPAVIALYGIAGVLSGLAASVLARTGPDGALVSAGRGAAGIAAAYLAFWAVVRGAWPDEMSWGRVIPGLLALALAAAVARFARRAIGPRLVLVGALLILIAVVGTLGAHALLNRTAPAEQLRAAAPPGAPDVLLLSIDTLRSRNLGIYGHARALTPNIDRLAREGTRWERFYTPVPQTAPSFATILSGLHPTRHGLILNGWRLPKEIEVLPERLRAAGWQTMGFVSVAHLCSPYGFARGFDYFGNQNPIYSAFYLYSSTTGSRFSLVDLLTNFDSQSLEGTRFDPATRTRPGDRTIDEVLRMLEKRDPGRPLFLWVHLFDPHHPYEPPERLLNIFRETPLTLPPSPHPPDVVRERFDGYDGEVAFVDEQVGRLLGALGDRLDRTLVLFVSDHGEALGEHGYTGHANHLSEEIVQVPFIMRWPGTLKAGRVVAERGMTMDIAPTILDALGLPGVEGLDGRSLLGEEEPAPPLFLMTDNPDGRQMRGVLSGSRKLLMSGEQGFQGGGWEKADPELYDLDRDPGETNNLAAREARPLAALTAVTEGYFERGKVTPQSVDEETRRTLRALGYVE